MGGVKKWKMLFKKTFENIKRVGVHHASPHFLVGNIIANHGFESASFPSMMKERIDELPTMGTGAGLTTNNPNRESKIFTNQNTYRTEQGKVPKFGTGYPAFESITDFATLTSFREI